MPNVIVLPTAEAIAAIGISISTVVALVVQLVKQGLIDPRTQESAGRDALVRGLSYALNLALLLGYLALNHQLDGSMVLVYLLVAIGQFGVSHTTFTVLSAKSAPAGAGTNATSSNDVKVLPDDSPADQSAPA